jgi:hypothetical protein
VRIVLPVGITSPTVIFLLPPLILLLLLSLPLTAVPVLIVGTKLLFMIKFELAVLTDAYLLREFCDLHSPSTVAHFHPVIVEILFAKHLKPES